MNEERQNDNRMQEYFTGVVGCRLADIPSSGVTVIESPRRSDGRSNRLYAVRVGNGAVVTGTAEVVERCGPIVEKLVVNELFSRTGEAELSRVHTKQKPEHCFVYCLTSPDGLIEAPLPEGYRLELNPDLHPPKSDEDLHRFVGAFVAHGPEGKASQSGVYFQVPKVMGIALETFESFRNQGLGAAVASSLARWALERDIIPMYNTSPGNTPSIRLIRKLGFSLVWDELRG